MYYLQVWATLIVSHLTGEPAASPVLTKWWHSELTLATHSVFALRFQNLPARNSSLKIFKHEKEEKLAGPKGKLAGPAQFLVAEGLGPALNAKTAHFGNPCTNGYQSWWPKLWLPTLVSYQLTHHYLNQWWPCLLGVDKYSVEIS